MESQIHPRDGIHPGVRERLKDRKGSRVQTESLPSHYLWRLFNKGVEVGGMEKNNCTTLPWQEGRYKPPEVGFWGGLKGG